MDSFTFNTEPLTTLDIDLGVTTLTTLDVDIGSSTCNWDNTVWPPTTSSLLTLPPAPEPTSGEGGTSSTPDLTDTEVVPSVTVTETGTSPTEDEASPAPTTTDNDEGDSSAEEAVACPRVHGVSLGYSLMVSAGTLLCIMYLN